jgi:soluble lytic murein transglycosylase
MSKKQGILISLILVVLVGIVSLFYYFFPRIWGSVLYPLKYQDLIVKYAAEYKLEPTFVAGIIYTESHYNPQAVSRVGAKGLMQLMPATAKSVSEQLGESSMGDLFDPETNIRYGTFYIAQKVQDFNGNVNAALAAYNGGPAVGGRYVISRDSNIPKETQNFIKIVNSAKDKYTELYGADLDSNIAEKLKNDKQTWIQKLFLVFKI